MPHFIGHGERANWWTETERWLRVTIYRTMRMRRIFSSFFSLSFFSFLFFNTYWREKSESGLRHNLQANEKLVFLGLSAKRVSSDQPTEPSA